MQVFLREGLYIDIVVKEWVSYFSTPLFDNLFIFITCLGSVWVFVILGITSFFFLVARGKYLEGIFLNMCLVSAWITMVLLKLFFGRERPPGEHLVFAEGLSFPSGHAMLSLAFYGFVAYLLRAEYPGRKGKFLVLVLYLLVFFIGFSRVYLNVHYASDVLGGYLFGGIILFVFVKLLQICKKVYFNGS